MAITTDVAYARIGREVTARAQQLWEVALELHRTPELAFQEHRAVELLTGHFERAGFLVEHDVAGLPTAFIARTGDGDGPCVALLMEYDALPDMGHACGHNLIAAAGLGAALSLRDALERVDGTLLAVGTPAEEGGGGKVTLTEAGVFDGVDAALMFHPGVHTWTWAPLTAQCQVRVGFRGRAAHPTGDPTEGVDALAALVQLFNTLAVLGRRLPPGSHVQGIVTEGGTATNIVPAFAEGLFGLRGETTAALDDLVAELERCAEGVALSTGTTVDTARVTAGYEHFRDNDVLSGLFAGHLARAGVPAREPEPGVYLGSSDIGNVSTRVPAIHPFVAIMDESGSDHTPQFAEAAAGERGRAAMLAAAEALACTAADVLLTPGTAERAWRRLREKAAAGR
ncbi:amidohydrolase [Streptomyces sp. NPDC087844]|uniref:amidohydrolase n=1 Tax=Streptomyces sp. NPDC087844 TaxID=3365805 RepID=UPI00382512BB